MVVWSLCGLSKVSSYYSIVYFYLVFKFLSFQIEEYNCSRGDMATEIMWPWRRGNCELVFFNSKFKV